MPATEIAINRPLIGVTTSEVRRATPAGATSQADPPRLEMVLGLRYLQAIEAAGGVPMVIPPLPPAAVGSLVDNLAGLCLSGGPDIHPSAYGATPHPRLGPTEPELDDFELELVAAAERRGLPVFAICRGAQMINVARGGTLVQHLPDSVGTVVEHRQVEPAERTTHTVTVDEGSRLGELAGPGQLAVNSFHHQSVEVLGAGLVATAWAPDGTVEAFEGVDEGFLLGVQWHAEGLTAHPGHAALFEAFVDAGVAFADSAGERMAFS